MLKNPSEWEKIQFHFILVT